ncbi:ABC transporter ATP-binding protein [Rhizobiaceae bacterium n13]|uniref:ABC transporter ATP-binding protein n=1 Tax=Ferirhizobium litorale TaxID=2927786 RepID=A0AAE3U401_9HYPH|nr:ABC transporter ATP-binding protein [Fererhizobium litorale]MDI7862779.1 ABC transporter ATP-binding protein [Fererhizobium litorale]MDI7924357.1 ABC transporter ATP-binding protein [Fererhizobium litorale]
MLKVEKLTSAYGRIKVLHDISLDMGQNEIVAIVGSNGAGKTTLLRALSGVQPVLSGRIMFDGKEIQSVPAHLRVARGLVQSPEGRQIFGPLSVEDNLRLGAFRRARENVEQGLAQVYAMFPILAEKRALAAQGLSGGQQQMLAIGRALMAEPKLLLLDEPSLGLSPLLVDQILAAVVDLRNRGMAILLVEQNASAALAIADRGYVLETGNVVHSGEAQALLSDPKVKEAYLGL